MKSLRFVDLFAGIGGFHLALSSLGHECVFASEINEELRQIYLRNFPSMKGKVFGDIRSSKSIIPDHDILCAGFPCQPFSKSGGQLGTKDETRGTLFHEILEILDRKRPKYILLENVGNFGRHDGGRTWKIVKERLFSLGYDVLGTEHRTQKRNRDWRDAGANTPILGGETFNSTEKQSAGVGLISPHQLGHPHHRERFYIVAALEKLPSPAFPVIGRGAHISLSSIEQSEKELTDGDRNETCLSPQHQSCIDHWNELLRLLPEDIEIPSFPIWGDELGAMYPFEFSTPWATQPIVLGQCFNPPFPKYSRKMSMLSHLPSYAREEEKAFRNWKIRYIRQNRDWWSTVSGHLPSRWPEQLKMFPPSLRKLEWNAKGGERNLWHYVLQFRPSGLRAKRYTCSPALIAMTATQIPILGPKKRFITRIEGLRLQGFPDNHELPVSRTSAFRALGNAVHVDVVMHISSHLLGNNSASGEECSIPGRRIATR